MLLPPPHLKPQTPAEPVPGAAARLYPQLPLPALPIPSPTGAKAASGTELGARGEPRCPPCHPGTAASLAPSGTARPPAASARSPFSWHHLARLRGQARCRRHPRAWAHAIPPAQGDRPRDGRWVGGGAGSSRWVPLPALPPPPHAWGEPTPVAAVPAVAGDDSPVPTGWRHAQGKAVRDRLVTTGGVFGDGEPPPAQPLLKRGRTGRGLWGQTTGVRAVLSPCAGRGGPCGRHAGPRATAMSRWVVPSLAENAKLVPPVAPTPGPAMSWEPQGCSVPLSSQQHPHPGTLSHPWSPTGPPPVSPHLPAPPQPAPSSWDTTHENQGSKNP